MIMILKKVLLPGLILCLTASCFAVSDDAIELFETALEQSSRCAHYFHVYKLEDSLECYEAIEHEAEHPLVRAVALQGIAYVYQMKGMTKEAIEILQEALHASHPYDEAVLFNARLLAGYSELLLEYEQFPLAERYLQMALNLYETYAQLIGPHAQTGIVINHAVAKLYFYTNRFDLARASISKAAAYADHIPGTNPLTSLLLLANIELAESHYEAASAISGSICESDTKGKVAVEGCILGARTLIAKGEDTEAGQLLARARLLLEKAPWEDESLREQLNALEGGQSEDS